MAKNVTNFRGEIYFTPNGNLRIKDEPVTPIEEDFGDHNHLDCSFDNDFGGMRKSMSMNDIAALREDLVKLEFCEKEEVYNRYRRPSVAPQELSRTKFVSMAEAIYHYQRDTPGRFHSTRPQIFRSQGNTGRTGLTVPQSPMLRCKGRSRPLHVVSQKEKEEMELEEIKKFKIKAHPIPKSVIEGPHLPEVQKKPITVPAPFNLTEIHKKAAQSPEGVQNFKARPAPKHILEKPHIPVKPPVQVTKPVSPKFHYKRANSADHLRHDIKTLPKNQKPEEKPHIRMGPLKPEPFSFEKRDEDLKRRREERIKRQIEEERKQACLFKAQPVPGAVKKRMHCATAKCGSSTASSENKENIKFEARPPVVLYKEPFKPVLKPAQMIKAAPFELTTEKRAAERERFDKQLKEKEEELERMKLLREKEQLEAEEKATAELRAKLVHHAKPVPALVPFHLERSVAPLTVPETPKFIRRQKQN
ncbi:targeting protein for Xklp2 [Anticarsia gemmatalis]|uniref:targeting protein for Xklp2 n=1 Tax=Anticarsia gemmatalis TaxID=129554 RepID=UPI003F75CCF8